MFKIAVEKNDDGIWEDVRGAGGQPLLFSDEASARAKLRELFPVLVKMESYGDPKRTRVLKVIEDDDDWPKRKA